MPRKTYDPLNWVPTPNVIRQRLAETLRLAERLRILLKLAEQLHPVTTDKEKQSGGGADE